MSQRAVYRIIRLNAASPWGLSSLVDELSLTSAAGGLELHTLVPAGGQGFAKPGGGVVSD